MPVLPLIDLLILLGSGSLMVGFVLKSIVISTSYRPTILGFSSIDFVVIAGICMGLALTLAARTWVKLNESRLQLTLRRRGPRDLREMEFVSDPGQGDDAEALASVDTLADRRPS